MDTISLILIITTFIYGLGAGVSFDVALVKLPTRHRIGVTAYANFARGNDLGNGIIVYPIVAISGALILFTSTIIAYSSGQPPATLYPLYIAVVTTILAFLATAKAAPIMLSLKNTSDVENVLKDKLNRFAHWHTVRTVCHIIAFFALIWTLGNLQKS
jgi:hypothetical protein